jgi:hypothetical protein
MIQKSQAAFRRDLPELLSNKRLRGQWVAYHQCETVRDDANKSANGPDWIRTSNQGIMSPLLCR